MHNLHLIVVRAENGSEACSEAEGAISDWGNENNWRSIGGAVSEDGEVHYEDPDARWQPEDGQTIEDLQESVQNSINNLLELKDDYGNDISHYFNTIMNKNFDAMGHLDYYKLKKWAEGMSSARGWEKDRSIHDKFNILTQEYQEWHFDEYGVTNMVHGENGEGKLWVVFLDMHR